MSCSNEWGQLLSKLVDGEVTPDEKRQAEAHLEGCAACTRTLELFQRNDKVLDSALAGEAFGDLVVEGVIAEIRRIETPPVVAPEAGTGSFGEKLRRMWPVAAAAAAVLVMATVILASRAPDLRAELGQLQATIQQLQDANELSHARMEDLKGNLAYATARNRSSAYLDKKAIVVEGTFQSPERFDSFEVQRSLDEGKTWSPLKESLKEPRFEDRDVSEGVTYGYRFIGHGKDLRVETAPISLRLPIPGGLDPLTSLEVVFKAVTRDSTKATFAVRRYVDGTVREEWFVVGVGERIGGVSNGIDYSTDLILNQIADGDQVIVAGDMMTARRNKLAWLNAAHPRPGEPAVGIWCKSSRLVPIP